VEAHSVNFVESLIVMAWPQQIIHFVDFEGSVASGILEYGVVALRGTDILETHTRLCRATGRVRAEDAAVHGLDADAVAAHAPFGEDFEKFARWRETGPLAAHFANAENTLIKSVWPYPRTSPDFARPGAVATDWGPWVDTGRIYPQLYPSLATAKLGDLVAAFALQSRLDALAAVHCPPDRRRYHAALYDALAGALLLARLADEPAVAGQSAGWLLAVSTLDPEKRDALRQSNLF
jgi:DNA polymerase-3 subunit epsilon